MSSTNAVSNKNSVLKNILIVLMGALLMGFLWRIRGTNGWGSSWGLLNAGAIFSLFAITIIGDRKKTSLAWVGLSAFSFMLTVPTWGTFLDQITGSISSQVESKILSPETGKLVEGIVEGAILGEDGLYYIAGARAIPMWSAVSIMLILGFGLATIWGIMLGRSLSDKQWKIRDFVLLVAVFFAAMYASRATLAHTLTEILQPEALDLFKEGLFRQGVVNEANFESIYKVYMDHFDDMSWAKKIMGGRNYFAFVETISIAIGGIVAMLTTRFVIKDKRAANMGLITSVSFAIAITVADLFFYFFDSTTGKIGEVKNIYAWSCWEYFTGFIAGIFITATILFFKNRMGEDVREKAFSTVPAKITDILQFLMGFVAVLGINIVRPVLDRLEDTDFHIPALILAFIGAVIFIVLSIKKFGVNLDNTTQVSYSYKALVVMMIYMFCIYMFTDFTNGGANIMSASALHNIAMAVSFFVLTIYFAINMKKTLKDSK